MLKKHLKLNETAIVAIVILFVVFVASFFYDMRRSETFGFKCPNFETSTEYIDSFAQWQGKYTKKYPEATSEEAISARGALMEKYKCEKPYFTIDDVGLNEFLNKERQMTTSELLAVVKKTEAMEPPRITGNETEAELYSNPYIKHIRTALNGYLDGSNTGAEEIVTFGDSSGKCGLFSYEKPYYKSKFFIYDASDNEYGGVQVDIVFVDKPDTLFWAWVYRLGGDGEYSLRGFCKAGPTSETREAFTQVMEHVIKNGDVRFSL